MISTHVPTEQSDLPPEDPWVPLYPSNYQGRDLLTNYWGDFFNQDINKGVRVID